ncbi:MAG TPA: helix-hairpin-helix domain-containing protein [Smithellaceae bacterium]|nr:helix-hairpin-helix domain-containing protein [Geobacteraceae bacterium]HPL68026.1 helix-hairpin-helix domain-containing protein [Smithellaceae bacterium]
MDTISKLQLLSDASRYDLFCACGTKKGDDHRRRGSEGTWLYPVSLASGGTSIMLKTLMSNVCVNDCKYCPFRAATDVPRCTISPDEMATIFMAYVRRQHVFGIFLTSGVVGSPDNTMRLLNDTARILRAKHGYRGYVHIKIIPGASDAAIEESLSLAAAVSINIETPGPQALSHLSAKKNFQNDIIRPLKFIAERTAKGAKFHRVKQTTQFVVGASDETDSQIVKYTAGLYDKLGLSRVYFSAYQRGSGDPSIPGEKAAPACTDAPFIREHRLYQVDFLFRKYGFTPSDIHFDERGALPLETDPKQLWADRHPEYFPVNINRADKTRLLRVPGIGPLGAKRILDMRKERKIARVDSLPVKGKRLEMLRKYVVC